MGYIPVRQTRVDPSALWRGVAVALVAATVGVSVDAQDRGALTYPEAVTLALRTQSRVASAQADEAAAVVRLNAARAGASPIPNIAVVVQPAQRYGLAFDQTTGQLSQQTTETIGFQAATQLDVSGWLHRRRLVEAEVYERESATYRTRLTRQAVVIGVAERYLAVLGAESVLEVQRRTASVDSALSVLVGRLVESGTRPLADARIQEASTAGVAARLRAAELDRARTLAELSGYVGLEGSVGQVEGELRIPESPSRRAPEIPARQSAGVASAEASLRAAEVRARAERADVWPGVSVSASVGTGYSSLQRRASEVFGQFDGVPLFVQLANNRAGQVGLTLSLPVLDRSRRWEVRLAEAELDRARAALDVVTQDVADAVRTARLELAAASLQLEAAQYSQVAAELALEDTRARYREGVVSAYDVYRALLNLVEAEVEVVALTEAYWLRVKRLAYEAGTLEAGGPLFGPD